MFKDRRSRALFAGGATLLFAGLAGCPSYTFLEVLPERITENQIIIEPGKPVPADILFVVDNSCSMEDEQDLLARNFDAFIQELTTAKADYRMGVVTTDLSDTSQGREWVGVRVSSFAPQPPKQLTGVTATGCQLLDIQHSCFRGPEAAKRVVTSEMPAAEQVAAFGANVRVGSCGSGDEEGLSGLIRGLERMADGDCNAGFLRPGANLVVVILSDEDDQSKNRPGLSNDVGNLLNRLAELKPMSQIRFAGIIGASVGANGAQAARCSQRVGTQCGGTCQQYGPPQGSLRSCGAGNPCSGGEQCSAFTSQCVTPEYVYWTDVNCAWCSYYNTDDCCSALAGNRYMQFARELEGRIASASGGTISATGCIASDNPEVRVGCLVDSICQNDFSATLKKIATDLIIEVEVVLNPPTSYPPGVVLKVNGETWKYGEDYTVNPEGTRLRYLRNPAPGEGDVVEVFYTLPQ